MTAGPVTVAIIAVLLDGFVRLGSVFGVTILAVRMGIGWLGGWLS